MRDAFLAENVNSTALRALNYLGTSRGSKKNARLKQVRLGSMLENLGAGYKNLFSNVDVAPGHGVEVLSQTDMFAAEPSGRHIRKDCLSKPGNHLIRKWQVLIAGAGQMAEGNLFGRSIIADDRLAGKYLAYHALDVTFSDPGSDPNLYSYAFLNTTAGIRAVKSCAFGTSVPALRLDLMKELRIPVPEDRQIVNRVASLIRISVEQRETYLRELNAARRVIEDLPEMREAHAMCEERKTRAVTWGEQLPTLLGWTYASAGGATSWLGKKWTARVGDVLEGDGIFYGLLRQRIPCDVGQGVPLITQRDALSVRQLPSWIARPGVPAKALFSRAHSLVMAGRGTLGEGEVFARPALITPGLSRYALTQDLLRILPKDDHASILYPYLSTTVGFRLIRACAVGTKILQIRLDLLRKLPFPEMPSEIAQKVRHHHEASVIAYDAAQLAEAEAIRIIEEEVLPAWLA